MNPVSYEIVAQIGVISVNNPPVNALSQAVRSGIQSTVRAAQTDSSKAILIICEGNTFFAGADISEFGKPPQVPYLPDLINEIEASGKLVIAAMHGMALGGGLELALGCHYRIALDSARVGLPEVKLGLLPGAGGTQRVPRLIGIPTTLQLILGGTPMPAVAAAEAGLIDSIVSGDLREAALEFVRTLVARHAPLRRSSELEVADIDPQVFADARAEMSRSARGQTAPLRIIESVRASSLPFAAGQQRERELFVECMRDPQSAALRHLFFAEREAARIKDLPRSIETRRINQVAIIGAGTMGGGIAMCFANAGFDVTLLEVSAGTLARGLAIVEKNYAGSVQRGKLDEQEALACRARIQGTTDYAALADADLVIEAVFEDPQLKKEVFAKLDTVCKSGAILATNTSYQDVDAIAATTRRAADVIGMHFFSPAHIMKLLEVVRGKKTADDVLATVMALGKRIGKVPVMSGVCYGFIGNRMLQGYFREAQLCLIEGSTPQAIDTALYDWGMAMGPISVADLAGLDVGYKARQALAESQRGDPRSYRVPDVLVEMGRLGQKSGAGFYRYDAVTRARSDDAEVMQIVEREAHAMGIRRRPIAADEIVERLIFALINEGMNILDEGIAQRPGDIDVVYTYGYGFPSWRGGPMYYADTVGLNYVIERIEEFRKRLHANNWQPAALLKSLVAKNSSLARWAE
ncbi:MAG: 3-hydroxyacyl-CoA dehydrogenase NAD-binding domain-containing protein [Gammaproteobacteria bacterium]|nr:3-hydroxyacyl-CoA dehydrogenase NAD-binding domain-containing protein [Gammaproteobacteria bacterium]MDH5304240.1 3-hydroxyacyl-CoA dehydrogenase NAD-binding domain-containing protein [Gammaproteobacteria bacterium]MDH5321433.1 3-hydroxyacyl-CoA dehydrogenase NAD-binding domain-containing protein [Gammaproteobacteria bacterium]